LECAGGIAAKAGVYFGGLEDGAAGSGEPAKAGSYVQCADGTSFGAAEGDLSEGFQVLLNLCDVDAGEKCFEPGFVQGEDGLQEFLFRTIEDDPDIQELFALDPGHNTKHGVFKQVTV